MRQFWIVTSMAALAFLPACTSYRTEANPPSVSYSYNDDDDYPEVAEKAEDHCRSNYGRNARLVDRDRKGNGYEATFSCE